MNSKPDPIAFTTKPLGTPVYTCSVFTRGDLMSQRWFLYTLCIMPSKPHQNEVGRSNSGRASSFRSINFKTFTVISFLYVCMVNTIYLFIALWKHHVNLFELTDRKLCNNEFTWCFHKAKQEHSLCSGFLLS